MERKTDLFLVILLILLLNVIGITWGIPKSKYLGFFYSAEREAVETAGGISEEYVRRSWEMSKDKENRMPRSVFNVIRSFHPDEHNIIKSISNMRPQRFDFNPHFFEYPSFLIYFTALLLGAASVFNIVRITTDISYYFINPDAMGRFYLTGRTGVIILSVLGVLFLYKAVENFFDRKTAFFSALALAVTPLYVINSHFLTVDVPMVFWIILAVYFLSLFQQKGSLKFLYLSGLTTGFAAGTKYPALFIWFLIPLVYASRKQTPGEIFSFAVAKAFVLTIIGFLLTTPYSILAFPEFRRDLLFQIGARGFGMSGKSLCGRIGDFVLNTHAVLQSGFCCPICLLSSLGIIYLLARKGKGRIFIAGMIFALVPLFLTGGVRYARYYLLVSPFISITVGVFLAYATGTVVFGRHRVLGILLIILFLMPPFLKSIAYSLHMNRQDIRITAAMFIEKRIPEDMEIVFTSDPWIFEVPPVNRFRYNTTVIEEERLGKVREGSYLVMGELQHFLAYGSRKEKEQQLIKRIEEHGYVLEERFDRSPHILGVKFDSDVTVHDMVYTHPAIYLFKKI